MRDEGSITVLRIVGQVDFTLVVRCLSRGGDFMREVALLRPVTDEHGGTLTPMDELAAILAGDISWLSETNLGTRNFLFRSQS